MIAENSYLIPEEKRKNFCDSNQYLLMAIDLELDMEDKSQSVESKLESMLKNINSQVNSVSEKMHTSI